MLRIATLPFQQTLADGIQRAQAKLVTSQEQLTSGKKATSYSGLGGSTLNVLSAHSMLSRNEAYAAAGKRLETTLSFYETNLTALDNEMSGLRQNLLNAAGLEDGSGLDAAIEGAFAQFRTVLNTSVSGEYIFAGSQSQNAPFHVDTLADAATTTDVDAFSSDTVRHSVRLSDEQVIGYGIDAATIGADFLEAFRTLQAAGPFSGKLTAAQKTALADAAGQLDAGLGTVRAKNAQNGREFARLDSLMGQNAQRGLMLEGVIAKNEDADLATVAMNISQQKAVLEASYSVFAQISGLSLSQYLR